MELKVRKQPLQATITPSTYDAEKHTVEVVFATETTKVKRYDWRANTYFIEVLSLDPKHINLERMNAGAPVLDSHFAYGIGNILGKVERANVENKKGIALLRFDQNSETAKLAEAQVRDGILTRVSCGYSVEKYQKEMPKTENELPVYRAIAWEPAEISFVTIPADVNASVRSKENEAEYDVQVEGEETETENIPETIERNYQTERMRLALRSKMLL